MSTVHVVHCVDTEGPFTEDINHTLKRINSIFKTNFKNKKSIENYINNPSYFNTYKYRAIRKIYNPDYLNYNNTWSKIRKMLKKILNKSFRNKVIDDFGRGWIYSWHCVDHLYFNKHNPRKKIKGYGKVFNFYQKILKKYKCNFDEVNWHFHPTSIEKNSIASCSTYSHSYSTLLYILSRRIIEDKWFPVVNRPGFHIERPDSHLFLEQWIPFDYANQNCNIHNDQPDYKSGRFGDWRRSPKSWRGYNPSINDYQIEGYCKRKIFRILNIGTRFNNIKKTHIIEAFNEAKKYGNSILAVTNHDYRNMEKSIDDFRNDLQKIRRKFKNVNIKFSGAEEAATRILNKKKKKIFWTVKLLNNQLIVELTNGKIFSAQPFLAIKTKNNKFYHENFDIIKKDKLWSFYFDYNTIDINKVSKIGIGAAGIHGGFKTTVLDIKKTIMKCINK
jgi:hypothetical protein